ncbi:MAG: polyhydroxyalkanoate synthesis regulator phasin [bacterium]|jgi:polyhydroxyalkanoate synthesis regulator phasin
MEPKDFIKQIIDLQKATFDMTFGAVSRLPEQGEKLISSLLEKTEFLPEDGRKKIQVWIDMYKKGHIDFRKTIETSLKTGLKPKELIKHMIQMQKATFDTTFGAFGTFQAQSEQLIQKLLEKTGLPKEGKQAFQQWIDAYKHGQDEFKQVVEEGFRLAYHYFDEQDDQ